MLFVTATYLEAKPIINTLNLKSLQKRPFQIYEKGDLHLIITGIGKIKAATALGYIHPDTKIINIGIAAGKEIGKLFAIKKVIDKASNKVFHLSPPPNIVQATLTTFSTPLSKPYPTLVDMEGSALVESAYIFKQEIILFKIISDNFDPKIDFNTIPQLIQKSLPTIFDTIALKI